MKKNRITMIIMTSYIVSAIILISLGFVVNSIISNLKVEISEVYINKNELQDAKQIVWLDIILTQLGQNYSITGDSSLLESYDNYLSQLDNFIIQAKENATTEELKLLFMKQDTANLKLVELETKAFELASKEKIFRSFTNNEK